MKTILVALKIFLFFTVLTGMAYPLLITGIAQIAFPFRANGSVISRRNQPIGCELIGQEFDSDRYFSSRPSAVSYNPLPSGGSNFGLTSFKLQTLVADRKRKFIEFNRLDPNIVIPSEMVFASASGLDPHISPRAAMMQVERVSAARRLTPAQKQDLLKEIERLIEKPQYLVFGKEKINVLLLNLKLDEIK